MDYIEFLKNSMTIVKTVGKYPLAVVKVPYRKEMHYKAFVLFNIVTEPETGILPTPVGFEKRYFCGATLSGKNRYHLSFEDAVAEIESFSGDINSVVSKYTDRPKNETYAYTITKERQGISRIYCGFTCTPDSPVYYILNEEEITFPRYCYRKSHKTK